MPRLRADAAKGVPVSRGRAEALHGSVQSTLKEW